MAKSKKEVKEKSLEDKLYDTAELLRGNVSPTSYKNIALGLLFLKFISNRYDVRRAEIQKEIVNSTEKEQKYLLNLKDQYTELCFLIQLPSLFLNPGVEYRISHVMYIFDHHTWQSVAQNYCEN